VRQDILTKDKNARVMTAGDFNEFAFVEPLKQYVSISGLQDADAAAKINVVERYTYLFDMNAQQLDHLFVSESLARKVKYEHIHVNTWPEYDAQVSDHDPSVARLDVCA
jgi:predicted extracellular nuclease